MWMVAGHSPRPEILPIVSLALCGNMRWREREWARDGFTRFLSKLVFLCLLRFSDHGIHAFV
jgi:hypothetical protein